MSRDALKVSKSEMGARHTGKSDKDAHSYPGIKHHPVSKVRDAISHDGAELRAGMKNQGDPGTPKGYSMPGKGGVKHDPSAHKAGMATQGDKDC